ncbi:hem peroxidase [Dillenia turbinata]|uniref:Peroxidase n=1 Tax=Dillenia turbinata TaxID=194707 RepID=A0AAN8VYK8_9MAGN
MASLYCSLSFSSNLFKLSYSVLLLVGLVSAQLSSDYYDSTCPNALSIIKSGVDSAVANEARMGASLLRLHFHDCFVNASLGCDASILLDDTANFTGEKTAAPNANSVRGFDVVDTIKSSLESSCPGVVSCADLLAVAARDSVVALGGPSWTVQLGRRDSTTASLSDANSDIPAPTLSLSGLISAFSNKGLSAQEMVALSGSHTIGQARCTSFRARIYNETNIDSTFAASLQADCPSAGGDNNLSPLDTQSPTTFNTDYYSNLLNLEGLLHSDQQLYNGGSTDSQVTTYSNDADTFFTDFANAMIKMGNLSPLTGSDGQIRTNCRSVN